MIEVVAGVLVEPGLDGEPDRILLQQRPKSKDYPLRWEMPGGKVEGPHESHHSALARELWEELGIRVEREHRAGVDSFKIAEHSIWCGPVGSESHGGVFILFLRVEGWRGSVRPREGQGWGWFTREELDALWKTPGNEAARFAIARAVWGG